MTLALNDRVQQTGTANTTVSFTLSGSVTGFQSFAVIGNGNTTYYGATDTSGNWEVGLGTYSTTGPTLTRTTILASSNSGSAVTFPGAVNVFVTYPAEKSVNLNADGVMAVGSPINYSDTGIIATFASSVAGYNQVVFQNLDSGTGSSSNINVSHNSATSTTGFAELGINSTTFTGSGSFSIAGAAYLASAGTDLAIGTYGAYNLHFVTNSSSTDAMTIFNDGGISLNGLGDPGAGNVAGNKFVPSYTSIVSAGGTTVLTAASSYYQRVTGTSTQTIQMPDATTLLVGTTFAIDNDSTQDITITNGATTVIDTTASGSFAYMYLISNATVAGTWARYHYLPNSYDFGSTTATFGGATISNAIWQGTAVGTAYGGTGLGGAAPFTSGGALYANSASTLTSGTLPVTAGGTGNASFTAGYIPYGNGSSALSSSASLQFNGTYLVVGGTTPLSGATNPITAFSSSANNYVQTYVYNANSGTNASADFVAYTDNSTDTHGWADVGFTSSTYASTDYSITGPNEAYVLGSAPSGAGATGNLVYATDSTGTQNYHQWYVGGFAQNKNAWRVQLTSTLLQAKGTLQLMGSSSGYVGLTAAAAAGSTTYTLPSADGTTGQALVTNGSGTLSWASAGSNVTTNGLFENAKVISANYSITSGNNAISAGPVTVNSGVSVTVPAGSVWTIV